MKRRSQRKRRNSGFTIMEILIVLAIITALASVVGPKIMEQFKGSKVSTAKLQIHAFQDALNAYYLQHSMYPHTSQGLQALVEKPTAGRIPENYAPGTYFGKKEIPKDPFGGDYRYVCEDYQNYTITSDGPDRAASTEDDIKSE